MRSLRAAITVLLLSAAVLARADEPTVETAPPVVIATQPPAGTGDVAASTAEIRVTFSRPMRRTSWSWVKLSEGSFPKLNGSPHFIDDRTCVLPVALEPGRSYALWLNQPPHENFVDRDGRKAVPYLLVFATGH